mgnify:CR=1 FL=1
MNQYASFSSHKTVFKGFSTTRATPISLFADLVLEVPTRKVVLDSKGETMRPPSPANKSAGKSPKGTSSKRAQSPLPTASVDARSSTSLARPESGLEILHSNYHILDVIGSGSFSKVYKVLDRRDGQIKAAKVFPSARKSQPCLEANILKMLSSFGMNVPLFYESWIEDSKQIIVMEYCEQSLRDKLLPSPEGCKPLGEEEVVKLVKNIMPVLSRLHDMGVAHMDIKPDNILIAKRKIRKGSFTNENCVETKSHYGSNFASSVSKSIIEEETVYLLADFGISTTFSNTPGPFSIEEGDHAYMPLETLGDFDHLQLHKIDMFSIGLVILQCLTGIAIPPNGPSWNNLRQQNNVKNILENFNINSFLSDMVARCLDRDPLRRPSSMEFLVSTTLRKVCIERGMMHRENARMQKGLCVLSAFSANNRSKDNMD